MLRLLLHYTCRTAPRTIVYSSIKALSGAHLLATGTLLSVVFMFIHSRQAVGILLHLVHLFGHHQRTNTSISFQVF